MIENYAVTFPISEEALASLDKYTIRWLVSHFGVHDFISQYDAGADWNKPDYIQPRGEDE